MPDNSNALKQPKTILFFTIVKDSGKIIQITSK